MNELLIFGEKLSFQPIYTEIFQNMQIVAKIIYADDIDWKTLKLKRPAIIIFHMKNYMKDFDFLHLVVDTFLSSSIIVVSNDYDYLFSKKVLSYGVDEVIPRSLLQEQDFCDIISKFYYKSKNSQIFHTSVEEEFIYYLLLNSYHERPLVHNQMELLKQPMFQKFREGYQLLLIYSNTTQEMSLENSTRNDDFMRMKEYFYGMRGCKFLNFKENSALILFQIQMNATVMLLCKDILNNRKLKHRFHFLLGIPKYEIFELFQEFNRMIELRYMSFYYHNEIIYLSNNMKFKKEVKLDETYYKRIHEHIRNKQYFALKELLLKVFQIMKNDGWRPKDVKMFVAYTLYQLAISVDCFHDYQLFLSMNQEIQDCNDLNALHIYINSHIDEIVGDNYDIINFTHPEVTTVIDFIDQNYCKKLSVSDLATRFQMSEKYISKIFKLEMKQTLMQYILQKKIGRAQELLASTNFKIKEIGEMVGIEDQHYFNKLYRKYTNESPRNYRMRVRNTKV